MDNFDDDIDWDARFESRHEERKRKREEARERRKVARAQRNELSPATKAIIALGIGAIVGAAAYFALSGNGGKKRTEHKPKLEDLKKALAKALEDERYEDATVIQNIMVELQNEAEKLLPPPTEENTNN